VAIPHGVVLAAALAALLSLPCAVAFAVGSERVAVRRRAWFRREPAEVVALRQLESGLRKCPPPLDDGPLPCIERIAAELRRLDRQRRRGPATESTVWLAAVLYAYDEWLRAACRSLGVVEHLKPLEGMDRELERMRVESELRANGITFR
jgi:hypothetical protein